MRNRKGVEGKEGAPMGEDCIMEVAATRETGYPVMDH